MSSKKVFITGDGVCPYCKKGVYSHDPSTHHSHKVPTASPPKRPFISFDKNDPRPTLWDKLKNFRMKRRMKL